MTQTQTVAPNRGPDDRIICALDVPTIAEAAALVARVQDAVGFYKIGLQLFAAGGMDLARDLKTEGRKVFLDWKLHDIGATVEKAAANLARHKVSFDEAAKAVFGRADVTLASLRDGLTAHELAHQEEKKAAYFPIGASPAAGAPGFARGSTSAVLARGYKPRASGEPKARPLTS